LLLGCLGSDKGSVAVYTAVYMNVVEVKEGLLMPGCTQNPGTKTPKCETVQDESGNQSEVEFSDQGSF
jgi:hypothetical protein